MDVGRLEEELTRFFSARSDGIVAAYLFGSFARGDFRAGSDVDVAVLFREDPPPTLDSLPFRLEDELERLVRRPVQLITLNRAPVDLIHRVFRDGKILFEGNRSTRLAFEVKKRNEYFDLLPILRRYRKSEWRSFS